MTEKQLAIGIDFGGTSVKTAVVCGSEILDHAPPIATQDFEGPDQLIAEMARAVEDLRRRHGQVAAVGVGVPGFVDVGKGVVLGLTNVRGWEMIPLKARLERRIGGEIVVDNDANCMAFAEWKIGAGRGFNDLICVALGTGVGAGVIVNGGMVRGATFTAGEIGQTSIDYRGVVGNYGNHGALEDYIGNREIAVAAQAAYEQAGIRKSIEDCSPAALSEAARHGDAVALAQWEGIGRMFATAMMNVCWLLNPEAIVIGGGVARAGETLLRPFREHLFKQLSPATRMELKILPAAFGHEAGMIGAAAMALDQAGLLGVLEPG